MTHGRLNQQLGKGFEQIFETMARYCGLTPIRCGHSCRVVAGGRLRLVPGQLDWQLLTRDGRVAFVDTKSFATDRFVYSDIDPAQLGRSALYCEMGFVSGFVVWFRKPNLVGYFSGLRIAGEGPRSGFGPGDGVPLGRIESLDLKPLFHEQEKDQEVDEEKVPVPAQR